MLFWVTVGIILGIFIPAPYDVIARNFLSNAWAWIKSFSEK